MCTDISDYDSQNGDSGGPVFIWDGSSELVTLVGLHFGSNPLYDHAYFSPISGIRHSDDLGGIEVRAPGYRTSDGGGGGIGGGCNDCPFPE